MLHESHRPETEPATCKSQVQLPTATPPCLLTFDYFPPPLVGRLLTAVVLVSVHCPAAERQVNDVSQTRDDARRRRVRGRQSARLSRQ